MLIKKSVKTNRLAVLNANKVIQILEEKIWIHKITL